MRRVLVCAVFVLVGLTSSSALAQERSASGMVALIDPFPPAASEEISVISPLVELLDPFAGVPVAPSARSRIDSDLVDPFATAPSARVLAPELLDPWAR